MAIDGGTARLLSDAILDSFEPERLKQMLFYRLDKQLHRITMKADYESIVFDLIMAADSEGWLDQLVLAARRSRPAEQRLFEVAQRRHVAVETGGLETILKRAPDIRPALFRAALATVEGQVGKFERSTATGPVAMGTGFLVGPDLCMTSYHVVRELFTGDLDAADVSVRFDYKHVGEHLLDGRTIALADDWKVAAAPHSAADEHGGEPAPDELDFAVLRLAREPGREPVGDRAEPGAGRRGWIERVAAGPLRAGDDLLVLQHIEGKPLRLTFGQVLDVNANGTRLRHTANTDEGSSGSPCFTLGMELAAIHQAGDPDRSTWHRPDHNRAVPAAAVFGAYRPS
ncbi:trypsin-like peptidase domain-containing protein [Actinoplanes sp. LDG1-06]|uniref:Trypsin-like peptidase domain-containing protein n=1 Tax=Paractinoplanes ovalisporus TaxID=2810368 RepID=A0ABS2A4S9_9ACTN|nr:effector-associated domain EAD1-containing protein [Actinoplanes ovalisporus]MBM2614241.1 trypsin-like peptidase domain-containing protein [Actinoplanes ovalisporus]